MLATAGLVDIYSIFSAMVCELQVVNLLPFERYDKFQNLMLDLRKMTETLKDHSKCDKCDKKCDNCEQCKKCSWPQLHSDKAHIISGTHSDEGEAVFITRSVMRLLHQNKDQPFDVRIYNSLLKFTKDLYQELSIVYTASDKKCIEASRRVTDWGSIAIKMKIRGAPLVYALEKNFL